MPTSISSHILLRTQAMALVDFLHEIEKNEFRICDFDDSGKKVLYNKNKLFCNYSMRDYFICGLPLIPVTLSFTLTAVLLQ